MKLKPFDSRGISGGLGLPPKMSSFYKLGEKLPQYDIINKLADYFNVSTDYLLGRSNIKFISDYKTLSVSIRYLIKRLRKL